MANEDNSVALASNSLGYAMARREVGTHLRNAVMQLLEAADTLRGIGLIPSSMKLEKIAGSLEEQFEIDEDGDALAYLDAPSFKEREAIKRRERQVLPPLT